MADLEDLAVRMRAFSEARDWGGFHDLKSLTLALAGEVGEVAELVQWVPAEQAAAPGDDLRERLGDELADVLLYLVRLADVAGIDLGAAASAKLSRNEDRFPVAAYWSVPPERHWRPPAPWARRRPAVANHGPTGFPAWTCPHSGQHG